MSARDVDVDGLLALVDDVLPRLPDDVAKIAGFDADGTLWSGDVGDHAFLHAHDEHMLDDATLMGPFAHWLEDAGLADVLRGASSWRETLRAVVDAIGSGRLVEAAAARGRMRDDAIASAYAMQAWIYAPATTAKVAEYGAQLFDDGFARFLFDGAARLVDGLRARGVTCVVLSASHHALVRPGARRLGFADADVHGMTPDVDGAGRTLPLVAAPLYGDAKRTTLRARAGGKRPLLALGDSVTTTDQAMLQDALVPVAVEPKPAHEAAARAWGRGAILRFS